MLNGMLKLLDLQDVILLGINHFFMDTYLHKILERILYLYIILFLFLTIFLLVNSPLDLLYSYSYRVFQFCNTKRTGITILNRFTKYK